MRVLRGVAFACRVESLGSKGTLPARPFEWLFELASSLPNERTSLGTACLLVASLACSASARLPDQLRATDSCVTRETRVPNHSIALSFLTRQPNEDFVSYSGKARNSFLVERDGVGPATAGSKKRIILCYIIL